jgi:outer membrane protein, multidrug efflux system
MMKDKMMFSKRINKYIVIACATVVFQACAVPSIITKTENKNIPASFNNSQDSTSTGVVKWKEFFTDPDLNALIDTALQNNQELNIIMQEITMATNEVMARKGAYLPFLDIGAGAGVDKQGRYTRIGAVDASTEIEPGKTIPDPLPDYLLAANVSWQVDIWKKLRNARKSAIYKFLATVEGKNFMVTHLVSEIANTYYELMALDNQLGILKTNIEIQQNALKIVKLQKEAGMVTELAVQKFTAEVLKNQSRQFYIQQQIIETENRINFLVGRYPQPVQRNSQTFSALLPNTVYAGIPSQLLANRPDIRQAEQQLLAAKLDIKVARANFYPTLMINAGLGYEAFNPKFLLTTPTSLFYSMAGGLVAPVINRKAIKAEYFSANAKQIQAVYNYERTVLKAFIEVVNQVSNINNLEQSYGLKEQQVAALSEAINISITLFKSARADYMEVLMTQRDAIDARMELIETKKQQMNAMVNIYRALGGGWR